MTISATEIASIHKRLEVIDERSDENRSLIAEVHATVKNKIGNGRPGAIEVEIEHIKQKTNDLKADVNEIKESLRVVRWVSKNWTRVAIAAAAIVGGSGTISAGVQTVLQIIIDGLKVAQ